MSRLIVSRSRGAVLMFLITLVTVSCMSGIGKKGKQPRYVVFLNRSGADLYNVSARELAQASDDPARLASVTPLLAGRSYAVKRQPDSKPLTPRIEVRWEHRNGVDARSTTTSIEQELRMATGAPNEALVIVFGPMGGISVLLAPLESIPSY